MNKDYIVRVLETSTDSEAVIVVRELLDLVLVAKGLLEVSQPPIGILAKLEWEDTRKLFLEGVPQ